LQSGRPGTRRACELHTRKLWQSFADPDSYSDCDGAIANTDSNCNSNADGDRDGHSDGNSNGHVNSYSYAETHSNPETPSDTKAPSDATTSPVGSETN
jgi:hypothetical protein